LTEEIISALAALPNLHVVARTSSFQFKQGRHDVRDIGKILGVQLALEGSVRRDGRSIRIAVQLI
jgi:adenylate cyclase